MYKSNDHLCIVIATLLNRSILSTINSILSQNEKPAQIIICYYGKLEKIHNEYKNIIWVQSTTMNQVYQRSLALNYLKSKIKILLLLDDNIVLEKNCIKELIKNWNEYPVDTAAIGIVKKNYTKPKPNILHALTYTNSNNHGQLLKNGLPIGYDKTKKPKELKWINGGTTSWRLEFVTKIFQRNYPKITWSVAEDLIFSYPVSKKYKLILSNTAKCIALKKKYLDTFSENFKKGFYYSKILKSFVKTHKEFSLLLFYYSIISSSVIGVILNIFFFNYKKIFNYIGRIVGLLFYYKNIN